MEKYTKESLVGLSHEELENAVLSLQDEVGKEVEIKNMYYDWFEREQNEKEGVKARLVLIENLLHSWE